MVTSFGQDIFFNEVKYEAPNGEQFLEVAGPTGDDITGWQIILYDSLAAPYDTITLDEEFPETQACNGIIIVDVPVLFTTPGSGMALVNEQGQLVQYLTYGEETTGTSGIINGVTSENIGTQLDSIGSLQLTGVGEEYDDFTWNLLDAPTPDTVNIDQTFNSIGCFNPLTVLPVELVEFEGRIQGDNIMLSWKTLSETNHSHFEMLHSTTGTNMQEVGRVLEAKSESDETKIYEFIFSNITHTNNYFQLRQVDVDGQSELSEIILVVSNRTEDPIIVSPNPAFNYIDIEVRFNSIGLTDDANVMIIDSQGKNVFTQQISLSAFDRIDIDFLENGLYFLVVRSGGISKQVKFVKRKN